MEQYMWIIWLAIFIIGLVIEALTEELTTFFFAGGALVALILSFISGVPYWVEIIVFLAVSLVLLACLRPLFKKYFVRDTVKSNIETIVGKKGRLTKGIDLLNSGVVLIGDVEWTAITSKDDDIIKEGETVEVVAVKGNKLIVKPYNSNSEEK